MMLRKEKREAGFTLVEMVVAVAILGISLVSLIGLQTSYMSAFLRERNLTYATLYGKQLMALIEINPDPPEATTTKGNLYDKLKAQNPSDSDYLEILRKRIEGWTYTQEVQSVSVPPVEDAMRRVDLTVSWGEAERDSYTLVLFMRNPL